METKMVGPGFGMEVTGVEPSQPVAEAEARELRALLDEHGLLVLRCPGLDAEAHARFLGVFGSVFNEVGNGQNYVSNVIGEFPTGRLRFHQDYIGTPYPLEMQSLYAEEVVGEVAPTLFVSALRAYERLTPAQRDALEGLTAVQARDVTKSGHPDEELTRVKLRETPDGNDEARYPRATHPVIYRHPRTGKPVLFVNEYYTSHINELSAEESERTLQDAFAVLYPAELIYAHQYRPGDLVIWDNIALQHARSAVQPNTRRTLRRMVVHEHAADPGFRALVEATYQPKFRAPETAVSGG
jgi:taurine dioxygenase